MKQIMPSVIWKYFFIFKMWPRLRQRWPLSLLAHNLGAESALAASTVALYLFQQQKILNTSYLSKRLKKQKQLCFITQNCVFSRRIESLECALGLNMNFMFCKWINKDWKEVADEIWSLFFFLSFSPFFSGPLYGTVTTSKILPLVKWWVEQLCPFL